MKKRLEYQDYLAISFLVISLVIVILKHAPIEFEVSFEFVLNIIFKLIIITYFLLQTCNIFWINCCFRWLEKESPNTLEKFKLLRKPAIPEFLIEITFLYILGFSTMFSMLYSLRVEITIEIIQNLIISVVMLGIKFKVKHKFGTIKREIERNRG